MFDLLDEATGTSGAAATLAWARIENAACARRLAGMVTLLDTLHAASGSANRDQWYLDNWAAACAEIGANEQLTPGAASHLLLIGTALRDRLPTIAAVFHDGFIGFRLVATIVHRTALIKDPDAMRAVDTALATLVQAWGPMSLDRTDQAIDTLIAEHDPYALRRTHTKARSRAVDVFLDDATGLATLWATLFATDAAALDQRLDSLASTVCDRDPRTRDQLRSDAMGAIAHWQDHLTCLCGLDHCDAATTTPSTVVIHVVAHADSTDASGATQTEPDQPDQPAESGTPAELAITDDDSDATAPEHTASSAPTPAGTDGAAQHASLDGEHPPCSASHYVR